MGSVILGMPGPWAEDYRETADHYTTKIGGLPDWPTSDISSDLLKCRICGGSLCLVAQVYAPISSIGSEEEERTIYVLGCRMPKCGSTSNGWRALRVLKCRSGMQLNASSQEETRPAGSSESTSNSSNCWVADLQAQGSGGHDDENESDMDLQELSRALSEAASLASCSKKQNGSVHSKVVEGDLQIKPSVIDSSIPVVPCFYLYYREERSSDNVINVHNFYSMNKSLLADTGDEEKWEQEGYEYDRALGVDRTYLKFKEQMEAYPDQCLRYSYGGKRLLAAAYLGELGACELCGAPRHYEMQLMPPLLYFLFEGADDLTYPPEDWNWMTLIIYTCSKNCFHPSCEEKSGGSCWTVAEEAIMMQSD